MHLFASSEVEARIVRPACMRPGSGGPAPVPPPSLCLFLIAFVVTVAASFWLDVVRRESAAITHLSIARAPYDDRVTASDGSASSTGHASHPARTCGSGDMYNLTWRFSPTLCAQRPFSYACSPRKFSFLDNCTLRFFSRDEACNVLAQSAVRRVEYVGDSFVRQSYQALLMVLSGDYERGGVANATAPAECAGNYQFFKPCREHVPMHETRCDGRVALTLRYNSWPIVGPYDTLFDLVVWGSGNHPVVHDLSRTGINDAATVIGTKFKLVCTGDMWWVMRNANLSNGRTVRVPRIFWQVPHVRPNLTHQDEAPARMDNYSAVTSAYLHSSCGGMPTLDVRFFTHRMVATLSAEELDELHLDEAHWLRAVNVIKAQLLLNRLATEYGVADRR